MLALLAAPGARAAGGQHHRHGHHASCPAGADCAAAQNPAAADISQQKDMELFHFLADHGRDIRRSIKVIPTGVETVTESDDPVVVERLRAHVASMTSRMAERRPIHMRDPLFAEVFRHAGQIAILHEPTPKGVRVVETSDDPYVAKLIQAHAEVVSLFIKNGRAEMMKNHEVPAR
jgi:hypothetical protein